MDKLPYAQAMRAPDTNEIPLTQVTFRINEAGESSVVVDFEQVVIFTVSAGRRFYTLMIVLPGLKVTQAVQLKNARTVKLLDSKAFKFLVLGRKALKQHKNKTAIRIFTKDRKSVV